MADIYDGNAYCYLRVSTPGQVEGTSLETQLDEIQKYAKAHRISIIGRPYADEGISGTSTEGRRGFAEMIEDAKSGIDDVKHILVYTNSRFGRNFVEGAFIMQQLSYYDIGVYSITEHTYSLTEAKSDSVTAFIYGIIADIERDHIVKQTGDAKRRLARDGGWNGGFAPYGYKLVDGELQVQEDEAEVIRLIFDKYAHTTLGAIGVARWLNENGFKKKMRQNGTLSQFSDHFVKIVLDNPVYIGKVTYGRRKLEKQKGTAKKKVVKQKNYELYDGIHEALITEELWNEVRKKRLETGVKKEKREKEHEYILSGILRCPECGAPMYGVPSRKTRKDGTPYPVSYSYKCRNQTRVSGHDCGWRRQIACKKLDGVVEQIVLDAVQNEEYQRLIKTKIGDVLESEKLERELHGIEAEIEKLHRTQDDIERRMNALDTSESQFNRRYDSLDRRLTAVFDKLSFLEAGEADVKKKLTLAGEHQLALETAYSYMESFSEIHEVMSDYDKKQLLQSFIESIELYPEAQDGQWIKSIKFKFPIAEDGSDIFRPKEKTVETVVLLSKGEISSRNIRVEFPLEDMDITSLRGKATYVQIKEYIEERFGMKVSTLYISQIKRKCGLEVGESYNKSKNEDLKVPVCPPEKEMAIMDALKHFGII